MFWRKVAMKTGICSLIIVFLLFAIGYAQEKAPTLPAEKEKGQRKLTSEMLSMRRYKIRFDDDQTWIFNGRQRIKPYRYTVTGFGNGNSRLHLNFFERKSGLLIRDDTHEVMKEKCPLGFNFRPSSPFIMVPQDETWYPHYYRKTGTFHKLIKKRWVSFGVETITTTSAKKDEIYLAITIENRSESSQELELQPVVKWKNVHFISDLRWVVKGFKWIVPPKTRQTRHIGLAPGSKGPVLRDDMGDLVAQALRDGEERLDSIAGKLPAINTESVLLDDYYRRCIGSMALSRWERKNFARNPQWLVGGFMIRTAWDFSFCADVLAMADLQAVQDVVTDVLAVGKMHRSYLNPQGKTIHHILYIQDPFALKELIHAHMLHSGTQSILDVKAGNMTVYEWMKRWARKLHNEFGKGKGGLVDVGYGTEYLIEIRTDGYDHIVPVVNGLTIDLYRTLERWGRERKDPEAGSFKKWGDELAKAFHEHLWNDKIGWFENMYADGSKEAIWTYHLFDLLGNDHSVTPEERKKMVSHIKEGVFLGEFGMYGISRLDKIHWDRLDADFGGGGYYAGMPPRISRHLYRYGFAEVGWDILKRVSRQAKYFPYMPQSSSADEPFEFRTGGNMQISSAAALETVWFGIFGLRPGMDGSLTVLPNWNSDLGEATLKDFRFRGHSIDVQMNGSGYEVFVDGKRVAKNPHGKATGNLLKLTESAPALR